MKQALIILAAIGILSVAAVAHGLRTDRWGPSADLQAIAGKLQSLPKEIGDWTSRDRQLSDAEIAIAQVAGYLVREYRHKYTQDTITVMILCGRPGPISVHSPEVCYAGAGFVPGTVNKVALDDQEELWTSDFIKPGAIHETLRIHWGWSTNGRLAASNSPRTDYARSKALFKFYLIRPMTGTKHSSDKSPDLELLKSLRPFLKESLTLET